MDAEIEAELKLMRDEYKWLLKGEVQHVLQDVRNALLEASKRFPVSILPGSERMVKPDKFKLVSTSPNVPSSMPQIKCVVTLLAENICEADLSMKFNKQQPMAYHLRVHPDAPWRLQQIQDAGNYMLRAFCALDSHDDSYKFAQPSQLISLLNDVIGEMIRARSCLSQPRRKTLDELVRNPSMRVFKPSLPSDTVISFYVHAQKLILNVYQLFVNQNQKIDIQSKHQLECIVPWLNDVLVLFTAVLQQCQQLVDKLSTFNQMQQELDFLSVRQHAASECTRLSQESTQHSAGPSQQQYPASAVSQLLPSESKRTSLSEPVSPAFGATLSSRHKSYHPPASASSVSIRKISTESAVSGMSNRKISTESAVSGVSSRKISTESTVSGVSSRKISTESAMSGVSSRKISTTSTVSSMPSRKTSANSESSLL